MTWEEMIDKLVGCRKFKDGKYLSNEEFTKEELVDLLECVKGLSNDTYAMLYDIFIKSQEEAIEKGLVCK